MIFTKSQEYCIVSPQNQTFLTYTILKRKFLLSPVITVGDIISSSVLPGFSTDITELFSDIKPDED